MTNEELLESVGEKIRQDLSLYFFHTFDQEKLRDSYITSTLRRRLLPLLEAGQAMREQGNFPLDDSCAGAWDAALKAAHTETK